MIELAEISIEYLLFGFGFYSLVYFVVKLVLSKSKQSITRNFDNSACLIAATIGLIYLLGGFICILIEYFTVKKQILGFTMEDRLFGKYWFWYWLQPMIYIFSQLLWIKKLRKIILIRLFLALLFLASIETIVVYLTSMNRDYLPSTWSIVFQEKVLLWILGLVSFVMVTLVFHLVKRKFDQRN